MELGDRITALKGVGPKKAQALEKLNLHTIGDLLYFFPRDYQDRRHLSKISELEDEKNALVRATVDLIVKDRYHYGKKQLLRLSVSDGSRSMEVVFFNAAYLMNLFQQGKEYDFYGKAALQYGKIQMIHPDFAKSEDGMQQGILPVYPLTAGISQKEIRNWQKTASGLVDQVEEFLPDEMIRRNGLCGIQAAIRQVHFPREREPFRAGKSRLIFDELFIMSLGILSAKQAVSGQKNGLVFDPNTDTEEYIQNLPYALTHAQTRVVNEILADMGSGKRMNRLIQGDVGSGKTAVAEAALYKTVKSGFQGVFMAPTELLAKQHYEGLTKGFQPYHIRTALLTGSMTGSEKKQVLEGLAAGTIDILIGTHAIIQPDVKFQQLGLVITDEQHRFGVNQRALLTQKGNNPHVLVMTATPIPRTLAMILYGDLDSSVIDELPAGRQKIITQSIEDPQRDACYDFVKKEVEKGRQAYVVAPLIDESDILNAKSAEELYQELKTRFRQETVALLHGEMKQSEKDGIMSRFYTGEIQILVSTVIIEVGINVPNATVMVIESADRFGLAQLHQLRGRIGRGSYQSYCMLVTNNHSDIAKARSDIMVASQDGFYIAEKDLEIRKPGELFGTRQHGVPDLHLADLVKHMKLLPVVQEEAKSVIQEDPMLESRKYSGLRAQVVKLFGEGITLNL